MPEQTVTTNAADLIHSLDAFTKDVQEKLVTAALREGAKVYQRAVTELTPEAAVPPTPHSTALPQGALKSDVTLAKVKDAQAYIVGFGKMTRHVARFVDAGHRIVKGGRSKVTKRGLRGSGREVGQVEGKGFFRKAFEEASAAAEQATKEKLDADIAQRWKAKDSTSFGFGYNDNGE